VFFLERFFGEVDNYPPMIIGAPGKEPGLFEPGEMVIEACLALIDDAGELLNL
jgi:hypothetical protein